MIFETGTYVNGRRLPLQGRGWGFESLRAHHQSRGQMLDVICQISIFPDIWPLTSNIFGFIAES